MTGPVVMKLSWSESLKSSLADDSCWNSLFHPLVGACLQHAHSEIGLYIPVRAFQPKSHSVRSYSLGSTFEFKPGWLSGGSSPRASLKINKMDTISPCGCSLAFAHLLHWASCSTASPRTNCFGRQNTRLPLSFDGFHLPSALRRLTHATTFYANSEAMAPSPNSAIFESSSPSGCLR